MKIFGTKSLFSIVLILIFTAILVYAHALGITGVTRKNGMGCTCHGPNPSSNVVVSILGPDTLAINQKADYSVIITGGPLVRGGTDIAVSSGLLAPVSSDLRFDATDGELTHSQPKAPVNNAVTFNFTYTAPSSQGTVTMYANGNSVNFDGTFGGDAWNFAPNKTIEITGTSAVSDDIRPSFFLLNQNYPNPFNPSTKISFSIPKSGFVTLEVFNSIGVKITTLANGYLNAGSHVRTFSASNLSSGIYFYKLQFGGLLSVKKMILLK